ncbi:hypothetical protein LOTGIDRAFT_160265 [Lottia gigantea]|uniref:C-type lectin domain-containing protein n=1 Tax=Lottia gigantea TaxID=225164 RepID=V4APZ0_LOTGI|nr:hypothetical protein LOTGIDRAFT_160265 [Lottia gigantea]ESO95716.1 hypothetical protein LOTGIDRAFT_160265 [Lottia gigantea]
MPYTETAVQSDLVSCVVFCARRHDNLVVSYNAKNCFCLIHNSASVGNVKVSFVFLKYTDYADCFNSGYDLIYPHLEFCMKFYRDKIIWSGAHQACISDGARLITLDTDAKCKIAAYLPTQHFAHRIYVGGSSNGTHFIWSTGEEIKSCWSTDEPSSPTSQECVAVYTHDEIYLHDLYCSSQLTFLCEKSTIGFKILFG